MDTRSLQHYLGHRNQHTARYAELSPEYAAGRIPVEQLGNDRRDLGIGGDNFLAVRAYYVSIAERARTKARCTTATTTIVALHLYKSADASNPHRSDRLNAWYKLRRTIEWSIPWVTT
jgi:hypothetical protein